MANKLSRPINEGAGSQRESGYSQCLLRDRERFSREKQPPFRRSRTKQRADTYNMGAVRIQSVCCHDISNNQEMAHVHHTYLLGREEAAYLLHVRVFLTLPPIGRKTLIRGVKPHLWMWCCPLSLSPENCCGDMTSYGGRALSTLCTAPSVNNYIIWAFLSSHPTS